MQGKTVQGLEANCSVECSPAALDCGPVQPATAVGTKLISLLKSLIRFTVTVPARCMEWANSFTLVTFSTVLFLLATHTMASLSFFDVRTVCLSTAGVTQHVQVYRLFTYVLFHSSTPHLLLNVAFLSSVGKTLEGRLGSFYLFNVILIFGTSCAFVQIVMESAISVIYPPVLEQCIAGFSGVLFGVLILALGVTKNKKQSLYGFCYIPKPLYPWLLLLACQIVTYEQISVVANLAGIVTGYAYIHDFLNFVKLTPSMIYTLEHSEFFHWVTKLPGFVHYPRSNLIPITRSRTFPQKKGSSKFSAAKTAQKVHDLSNKKLDGSSNAAVLAQANVHQKGSVPGSSPSLSGAPTPFSSSTDPMVKPLVQTIITV